MILPDHEIRQLLAQGKLIVEPSQQEVQLQPAGIDLRLGDMFRVFKESSGQYIDPRKENQNYTELVMAEDTQAFVIHPGEFVLGIVREYIKLPDFLMGSVDGRSTLGRLGVTIHTTSASTNPGWEGKFVLEINTLKKPKIYSPGPRPIQKSSPDAPVHRFPFH